MASYYTKYLRIKTTFVAKKTIVVSLTPSHLWSPTDNSDLTDFASRFALAFGAAASCECNDAGICEISLIS